MKLIALVLALILCACGPEMSFEERYAKSQDEVDQRARELDRHEKAATANAASEGN